MMLKNLLVVELSSVLAGPLVGQFLAELGARVIKVENAQTGGDVSRRWKVASEGDAEDRSAYFLAANTAKESIALNLDQPEDLLLCKNMIARADVLVHNYKPGDEARWGLGYEHCRQLNPSLIYASIDGFGPDVARVGYDAVIQAESGFMEINGEKGCPPTKLPVALMDVLAAQQLRQAILLALLHREQTGEGSQCSCSLWDAAVSALVNQASNVLNAHTEPEQQGSDHPNIAPYGTLFRTRDQHWISFAVGTDAQFEQLRDLLNMPVRPEFSTNVERVRNRATLKECIGDSVRLRHADDLYAECLNRAIPVALVRKVSEALAQPASRRLLVPGRDATGLRTIAFRTSFFEPKKTLNEAPHYDADGQALRSEFATS